MTESGFWGLKIEGRMTCFTYSRLGSLAELFGVFVPKQNYTGMPNLNFEVEITEEKSKQRAGYSRTYDRHKS